jgi:DNA-binding Lrp family transcriptional regulator
VMEPTRKSWRDAIAIHPAADLFPMMSAAELRALGEDIKAHGLQHPITIVEKDGRVHKEMKAEDYALLDGRNRLDAMELVGIAFELAYKKIRRGIWGWCLFQPEDASDFVIGDCAVVESPFFLEDPYDYVLSLNVHRRHLTNEQKRNLIAKVIKAKPALSDRQIAEKTGTSHPTVAKVRDRLEESGDVEKFTTSTDTMGREQPRIREAAKLPEFLSHGLDIYSVGLAEPTSPDRETPEQFWQCSLGNMAGEAVSLESYWTKQFGPEWKQFRASSDLVTLAKQAAEACAKIAERVETQAAEGVIK